MRISMEDWLRGCVYHDGRHGEVTLSTDKALEIANYIQLTRTSLTDGMIELPPYDRKYEPNSSEKPNNSTISKMEQVDKDINVRSKDEPQTDYGDFADRLAYARGVKHAWEVAQKVFGSTVTFYEAEDVAKQIDKDINVRSKDEPQNYCKTCKWRNDTVVGGSECVSKECVYQPKDEPQTERGK